VADNHQRKRPALRLASGRPVSAAIDEAGLWQQAGRTGVGATSAWPDVGGRLPPDVILIGTGSGRSVCVLGAYELLTRDGIPKGARRPAFAVLGALRAAGIKGLSKDKRVWGLPERARPFPSFRRDGLRSSGWGVYRYVGPDQEKQSDRNAGSFGVYRRLRESLAGKFGFTRGPFARRLQKRPDCQVNEVIGRFHDDAKRRGPQQPNERS